MIFGIAVALVALGILLVHVWSPLGGMAVIAAGFLLAVRAATTEHGGVLR